MVMIGINMFDIFPWLRKFKISMPKVLGNKLYNNQGKHGPFIIGLLNGLSSSYYFRIRQVSAVHCSKRNSGPVDHQGKSRGFKRLQ